MLKKTANLHDEISPTQHKTWLWYRRKRKRGNDHRERQQTTNTFFTVSASRVRLSYKNGNNVLFWISRLPVVISQACALKSLHMQQKQISVLACCSSLFMTRCKFVVSRHRCSSEVSLPAACFYTFVLCKQGS